MKENNTFPAVETGKDQSGWNIFAEVWRSIRYAVESALGKHSLESYLSVLGRFTDSEILEARRQGLRYCGGKVIFRAGQDSDFILAEISLYFQEAAGKAVEKTAKQKLEKRIFTMESLMKMETVGTMEFQVEEPTQEEKT